MTKNKKYTTDMLHATINQKLTIEGLKLKKTIDDGSPEYAYKMGKANGIREGIQWLIDELNKVGQEIEE